VIVAANPDTQDYLWTIKESMGRMSEINRLTWEDVNFDERYVVLFTRKKKGGHLTPRKIPMTRRLYSILSIDIQSGIRPSPGCSGIPIRAVSQGKNMRGHTRIGKRLCGVFVKKQTLNISGFMRFVMPGPLLWKEEMFPLDLSSAYSPMKKGAPLKFICIVLAKQNERLWKFLKLNLRVKKIKIHSQIHSQKKRKGHSITCNPLNLKEPAMGFEPATC